MIHRLLIGAMILWGTLFPFLQSFAQQQVAVTTAPAPEGYGLETEVVSENIGILVGALEVTDLTGYSCTRLYVTMAQTDDFMSSVSGDANNPTYVNTTTNFYHAILGGITPNGINSLLFAVYPDMQYDSWVTIGLEGVPNAAAGEAAVSLVQSNSNPWATNFDLGGGLPGANIAIDDAIGGAWYALNGDANGVAGDDLKVLVGQFTTTGELSGQLYCQIFWNGDGAIEFRDTFYFGFGAPSPGCTDATACNYNDAASDDDGSCEYPADLCSGATNLDCECSCLQDADEDGICDEDEVAGCTNAEACNYDSSATDDNGSCTYPPADHLDCDGNCLNDADSDLICDEDEIAGCPDADACNYNEAATDDDGSCTFPAAVNLDCDGNCLNDADLDGVCDEDEIQGCTDSTACNYDATATDDDGSCESLSCAGCTDTSACNYDPTATIDDGSCESLSCVGCTGATACNYDPTATIDDESCIYPIEGYCLPDWVDCPTELLEIQEGGCCANLYCNGLYVTTIGGCDEIVVCQDPDACNYAGDDSWDCDGDNSLCDYPIDLYGLDNVDCDGACLNDADGDGVCDEDEVPGCMEESACNYNDLATDWDGSCLYPIDLYGVDYFDCDGNCLNDADGDGCCLEQDLLICADPDACNASDPCEGEDDGSVCVYPSDVYGVDYVDCDGNCLNDVDEDGICDEVDDCIGQYDEVGVCNGDCTSDFDGDGECDCNGVTGCTDELACNYDPEAGCDDGSCFHILPFQDTTVCVGEVLEISAVFSDAGVNGALHFPNSAQYSGNAFASTSGGAASLNITDDFTIEFWIRIDGMHYWHLMGKNTFGNNSQGWLVKKPGVDMVFAWTYVPNEFAFMTPQPQEWQHVAFCFNDASNEFKAFTNGQETYSSVIDINVNTSSFDFVIGKELGTQNWFQGSIDELRISSVVRYNSDFDPEVTPQSDEFTLGLWHFDEMEGNTAMDASSHGNHLVLNNTQWEERPVSSPAGNVEYQWSDGGTEPFTSLTAVEDTTVELMVSGAEFTCSQSVHIVAAPLTCMDETANNYSPDSACGGGECLFAGCTDSLACNFELSASIDDGSCIFPSGSYVDCEGDCLHDLDGDGVCDEVDDLVFNPDVDGDGCYTVSDLTALLCLFGTCGLDMEGVNGYYPYHDVDSCYSAFDLIPFLTLFQTCLEVTESAEAPIGGNAPAPGSGMNDDAILED